MKRIFISLALISIPTYSFCLTPSYYVGGALGADTAVYYQNAHVYSPGNFDVIQNNRHGAQGILAGLLAGLGYTRGQAYLGAELNLNVSTAASYSSNTNFTVANRSTLTYKINNAWGLTLLPGYLFNPTTLFYGRIGYSNGNFKLVSSDVSIPSIHQRLNGFVLGAGIEEKITDHCSVRFDYEHIHYQGISETPPELSGSVFKTTSIKPSTNQFALTGIYRFA